VNLFLIGFRCTGKTSVGQILARRLGWPLVDTDRIIVDMIGSDIARMVEKSGWAFFRKQERRALEAVCAADRQVVATGGASFSMIAISKS
jgi:shikimate kinase